VSDTGSPGRGRRSPEPSTVLHQAQTRVMRNT
jgi:hypothetical protein